MEVIAMVVIVAAGIGAAFVAYQVKTGRPMAARRAFARTPLTHVAEISASGVVRLSGTTRALGEPPVSEASGRPYLARDLRIVPTDGSDSGSPRGAQQAVDFLLDDGTGTALVHAAGGSVSVTRDFEAPRTTLDRVPWVDVLLREGGYHNGSPATCRVRVYEGVLPPGARAGVVGYAEPADATARAHGATIMVRAGDARGVVVRPE